MRFAAPGAEYASGMEYASGCPKAARNAAASKIRHKGHAVAKNKRGKAEAAGAHPALLPRVLPSLIFAAALALLVAVFYDPGYTALPGAEKRYEQAKRSAAALRLNDKRAILREHWERLAAEFKGIYDDEPDWPNRPAAFFRAAECLEDSARHSLSLQGARRAADMYEELAAKHPRSRLADDALFRAARLRAAWLRDEKGALGIISVIKKRHPGGDMLPEAIALEKTLAAAGNGRTAPEARKVAAAEKREMTEEHAASAGRQSRPQPSPRRDEPDGERKASGGAKQDVSQYVSAGGSVAPPPDSAPKDAPTRLTMLSWNSKGKDSVELSLILSGPASCTSRMLKSRGGGRMRLILDKVLAVREVEKGVTVRGSLLRGVRASRKNDATVLDIDFRQDVETTTSQTPGRVVVRAEAVKKSVSLREERQSARARPESTRPRMARSDARTRRLGGMADQLGLTVGTVFIDAGHGGRDPGAGGHNVLERRVTLDVAQALGRLLEASGLEVVYSRTTDKTISLADRTRKANEARADLFVSVHVNANEDTSVNGFETYYLDFAANAGAARVAALENAAGGQRLGDMQRLMADVMLNARVEESRKLAGDIQRLSVFRLKRRNFSVKDNGVKAAPFHVLIGAHMPAVLVELGYCTNSEEAANLASPGYHRALAEGLAEGILAYRDSLNKANAMQAGLKK